MLMSDRKLTQKQITDRYLTYAVGYCDIQSLLALVHLERFGYTSGKSGWNSSVYLVDVPVRGGGVIAISTGYHPFGDYDTDYRTVAKFEETARRYLEDHRAPRDFQRVRGQALWDDFIREMIRTAKPRGSRKGRR